jgi:hypothetical protein
MKEVLAWHVIVGYIRDFSEAPFLLFFFLLHEQRKTHILLKKRSYEDLSDEVRKSYREWRPSANWQRCRSWVQCLLTSGHVVGIAMIDSTYRSI